MKHETVQEACDYSVAQLVKQGDRCVKNDVCAYGIGKKHCAIGWLLDHDNGYLMNHEGDVEYLTDSVEGAVPALIVDNLKVFKVLQQFHDFSDGFNRGRALGHLSGLIDTSAPQYKQWMDLI